VLPKDLQSTGEISAVCCRADAALQQVIAIHGGGASVWDLRGQTLLAVVAPSHAQASKSLRSAGAVTAACFIGTGRADFATGHASGDVLLWRLSVRDSQLPVLMAPLKPAPRVVAPILGLRFAGGRAGQLVVFGKQEPKADAPGLTLCALSGLLNDEDITAATSSMERVKIPFTSRIQARLACPACSLLCCVWGRRPHGAPPGGKGSLVPAAPAPRPPIPSQHR